MKQVETERLHVIARMHSSFPEKFGIPRQSGIAASLQSTIVFERAYRSPEACRGLEAFSHIWLLWGFSQARREAWSPTVRPPRLGGNRRMGVFATRAPYRPNPIALSSVRLERVQQHPALGPVLHVSGADLMDGSPIYDIKPYLAYTDSHPEAVGGFADGAQARAPLAVDIPPHCLADIPQAHLAALREVLAHDPRPSYQEDPARVYGMAFAGMNVKFTVAEGRLTVVNVEIFRPDL